VINEDVMNKSLLKLEEEKMASKMVEKSLLWKKSANKISIPLSSKKSVPFSKNIKAQENDCNNTLLDLDRKNDTIGGI